MKRVDVVILGAGTAGLRAQRSAEARGATTLMFDPAPTGTKCASRGCMPSKLFIQAADVYHTVAQARQFGVHAHATVSWHELMGRVRSMRDAFSGSMQTRLDELVARGVLIKQAARFESTTRLRTDDGQLIEAGAVVIATGSSPITPKPWQPLTDTLLTYESFFDAIDQRPGRMLIVGAGAIGLELGQGLARLGVKVTILGKDGELAGLRDPVIRKRACELLGQDVELILEHELHSAQRGPDDSVVIELSAPGMERQRRRFDRALMAVGDQPNLDALDLHTASVALDESGLPLGLNPKTGQIGQLPIFLAGDVSGQPALQHEASEDGVVAGENAACWPERPRANTKTLLAIIFTHPHIARVGASADSLDGAFVGAIDLCNSGRAKIMGMAEGLIHIYADPSSGRLLGAELCAPEGEHLAHLLAWAVQRRLTAVELLEMPFYHPSLEEGLQRALKQLRDAQRSGDESGAARLLIA